MESEGEGIWNNIYASAFRKTTEAERGKSTRDWLTNEILEKDTRISQGSSESNPLDTNGVKFRAGVNVVPLRSLCNEREEPMA